MNYRASISIFLALVIFSVSSFFVFLLPLADAKRLESFGEAALLRQTEVVLASYHRDLMERYGIPGILEEEVDLSVLPWLLEHKSHKGIDLELIWLDDYSNLASLEQAILESMRLRMPVILIHEIWSHMKGLMPASGLDSHIAVNLSSGSYTNDPFDLFFDYLDGRVREQVVLEELMDPHSDLAEHEDFQDLQEEIAKVKAEKESVEHSIRSEADENMPRLDDFGAVAGYLARIRDKLLLPFNTTYDHLTIREFMVSYLSCEIRHEGKKVPLSNPFNSDYSPRMWQFSNQYFSSDHELECVATGLMQPILARALVQAEIFAIRFLLNAVAFYNDPGRMAGYRLGNLWQRFLVMVLTFFGLEPATVSEVIVCLRLLIDAAEQSTKDLADLNDGFAIPFFSGPLGRSGVMLDYLHYLRFLLLFSSNDEILSRFKPIMEDNVEGKNHKLEFCLELELQSKYHSISLEREAGYLSP